ncbi:PAS domain-containing protein [Desulfovibrio sp. OttesenSCG-928-A18]|nr:PAS domain-containing protein [Desulfovibrio sp. OttesenSCG-928-A18]
MSPSHPAPVLPRHTVMRFSPWFMVGSALILGLAIAFWAVKNARQERENLSRNLLDRAGALMWAMEGSARVGMGFRSAAAHLQFMLEETAKQPGIVYMAIITEQGQVLAHSNRQHIGEELHPPQYMTGLAPSSAIHWRIVKSANGTGVFETFKFFAPLPGFREHMRHGHRRDSESVAPGGWQGRERHRGRHRTMPPDPAEFFSLPGKGNDSRESDASLDAPALPPPPLQWMGPDGKPLPPPKMPSADNKRADADKGGKGGKGRRTGKDSDAGATSGPPGVFFFGQGGDGPGVPAREGEPGAMEDWRLRPRPDRNELIIVIGLDMKAIEDALSADLRNTIFTALLVGLLGLGGFLSLFWAQNYRFSRRLLLDTRAFADQVVSSLPLALIVTDAEGLVSKTNAAAEEILSCTSEDLLGKKVHELRGMDWAGIARRVGQSGAAYSGQAVPEEEHNLELPVPESEGGGMRELPVSVIASHYFNDQGESLGMMFLLRDLREVRRLQAELRRNERLSTLGNMAARVAHEIRNPLSSIKGFATFLGSRQEREEDKEAARTMIGEVDRLNRVVSELLDFARPSKLSIAPLDLHGIVQRAVRLVETDALSKNVSLRMEPAPPAAPCLVAVDGERITQAMLNLFLNAVQATDAGGTVTVRVHTPEAHSVLVSIRDTGRGMEPELLEQIFSPYFTTRATGTGLGLSIVSKIIEDHQGTIKVSSEPGLGTEVTLRLPLAE